MFEPDRAASYRAILARDPRFDGRLFVGVRTTGIYCRPICPARTPKLENIVFYTSAAAAQEAGFRPCLRCRPESSPEVAAWRGSSSTVSRALGLIAEGALSGEDADVEGLALRLGIGERQLRRLFQKHLGASPIAVAQVRRAHFAKKLIDETRLTMTEVAEAAGFGSVRRFNDTFRRLYDRPPSALRRHAAAETASPAASTSVFTLKLHYIPPYDWPAILSFFAARAIPGVELVEGAHYRRTIEVDDCHGTIDVSPSPRANALEASIAFPHLQALPRIVARIRRMFDLDADVAAIAAQLGEDRRLAPLVAARPGLRVPGAWDGFELAVRALLGQQITVVGARKLAGKLVSARGERLRARTADLPPSLDRVFPRPARLTSDLTAAGLGMPGARITAINSLARAALDPRLFHPARDVDEAVARFTAIKGIGEWTAQYIAMRAGREPDAFPASDIGLMRAMATKDGTRPTPKELLARAEAWRPWRAYAAQHLWTAEAAPGVG